MPLNPRPLHFRPAEHPLPLIDELRILGGVEPRFQPIFDLVPGSGPGGPYRLRGLELLCRGPAETRFELAEALFTEARWRGETVAVDRLCLAAGLRAAASLTPSFDLFVNVHGSSLESDADLPAFVERQLARGKLSPRRLVMEVVEAEAMTDPAAFRLTIERLRRRGVRIALDDLGEGHSTNRMLLAVRPDVVKLDRFLVRGVGSDVGRRALISGYRQMARELGSQIVAEGVETRRQLAILQEIGLDLCQGFLFARPLSVQELWESRLLERRELLLPPPAPAGGEAEG